MITPRRGARQCRSSTRHGVAIGRIIRILIEEVHRPGPFNFGDRGFVNMLRGDATALAADKGA